jgi:outer membrane protein OmpA-like peptidoglycan-associated protein
MRRPINALLATAPLILLGGAAVADNTDASTDSLDIRGIGEVFFGFDSATVNGHEEPIAAIAAYAEDHPTATIVLDAHTDSTGTAAYNTKLSIRRAEAVKSMLIANGIDRNRVVLALYGEDGLRRSSKALDRRVTAWATNDPLYVIVRHELPKAGALVWDQPVTAVAIDGPLVESVAAR